MFDELPDEPEPANKSTGGKTRTGAKYEFDVDKEAVISLAKILKQRQEDGFKPLAKIPLREDHEDAPPSVQEAFLDNLRDEVKYVGYRRNPEKRNTSLSQEAYDNTETSEFTEGLATELWRRMTAVGGDELQEIFGGSAEDPVGRIHAGHPQKADLDDRELMQFTWRETEHVVEEEWPALVEEYDVSGLDQE